MADDNTLDSLLQQFKVMNNSALTMPAGMADPSQLLQYNLLKMVAPTGEFTTSTSPLQSFLSGLQGFNRAGESPVYKNLDRMKQPQYRFNEETGQIDQFPMLNPFQVLAGHYGNSPDQFVNDAIKRGVPLNRAKEEQKSDQAMNELLGVMETGDLNSALPKLMKLMKGKPETLLPLILMKILAGKFGMGKKPEAPAAAVPPAAPSAIQESNHSVGGLPNASEPVPTGKKGFPSGRTPEDMFSYVPPYGGATPLIPQTSPQATPQASPQRSIFKRGGMAKPQPQSMTGSAADMKQLNETYGSGIKTILDWIEKIAQDSPNARK